MLDGISVLLLCIRDDMDCWLFFHTFIVHFFFFLIIFCSVEKEIPYLLVSWLIDWLHIQLFYSAFNVCKNIEIKVCVAETRIKFVIFLPQSPKHYNYRYVPSVPGLQQGILY